MGWALVEEDQEGGSEVRMITCWEISNASHVFLSDLALEFFQGNLVLAHVGVKLNSISVKPLAMGNEPELLEKASHPLACCFLGFQVAITAVLNHFPIFDWESKKEVVPSHQILSKDSSMDFWAQEQLVVFSVGKAEVVESSENGCLKERVSVFIMHVFFQGCDIQLPRFVCSFCSAHKDMLGCFRLVTLGAVIVGLFFPCLQSDRDSTVFRRMFWQCPASIEVQGRHELPTSFPINVGDL